MSGRVVVVNVTDVAQRHTAALISVVSPERAERAARYHFVADRMLSLVAGALITGCVGRAVGPGVALTFTRGPHGKPQCPQLAALGMDFNVSHTRGWVVCAVGRGSIGVDVQWTREVAPADLAAYLHPDELTDPALSDLLTLWTVREAYVKQLGRGMSQPADTFRVVSTGAGLRILAQGAPADELTVLTARHRSARLAVVSTEPVTVIKQSVSDVVAHASVRSDRSA